jgi:hypothetical protein
MNWIEWVGYLGAALVVLSFLVGKNMRRLRTINMLGAITFTTYGILLGWNWPIIIPNVFITCIQVYYLFIKRPTEKEKQNEQ